MNNIKSVYISGLGAVGGAYAGKLFDMNPDCVKVIANTNRIEHYKEKGIHINGKRYDFTYIHPEDECTPADLIIIAVKHHQLEQSISDIKRFVGCNTIILSLLNGISSEETIGQVYGMDKILYSFCVGTDSVRVDTEISYSNSGRIVFGEKTNEQLSEKAAAVKELFDKAGIQYSIPQNMIREQWWKFMMNVGINQVSAILKAPYGVFQEVDEAIDLMIMASKEVMILSEKVGINLNEDDIKKYTEVIKTLSAEGKTSMLQDVEAFRKTEVEIFAGQVINLGIKYGVETPVNNILFKVIRAMEEAYEHFARL